MAVSGTHGVGIRGDFEIIIGSEPSCKICLSNVPGISPQHAALKRVGDRLFIKDCGSKAGTFVNGKRLKRRMMEITRHDSITICNMPIVISPQLFLGRDRVGIETTRLKQVLKKKSVLCDGMFINAKPGTLTAVMGPSGSGKSVLLNLVNGYSKPTEGQVIVGGQFDLNQDYASIRDFLGYVPQDEVMIPQLTVRESLDYRLRLRFPDMAPPVRNKLIEETCIRLGFENERLNKFLSTQIGSSESGIRGLSGGERRRANIAHELITKPLILILDEPTSGLSSVDSDHIIRLLHDLAKQDNLTIIATIHQPSRDAFALFDNLVLVDYGGKLAYYGPATDVASYFRTVTGKDCGAKNPAEFVLEILQDSQVNSQHRLTDEFQRRLDSNQTAFRPLPTAPRGGWSVASVPKKGKSLATQKHASISSQLKTLLRRNLRVLFTDRINLLLIVGQVPIIVLLMLLGFHKSGYDEVSFDKFARNVYYFHNEMKAYEEGGKSVPVDKLKAQAKEQASKETRLISQATGSRRGSIFFLLVAASVWFGIMGSCKEIVSELHILRREVRSCISFSPYLLAKMLTMVCVVGVQTFLLAFLLAPVLLHISIVSTVYLWLILWLAASVSASMGLMLSSTFGSFRVVLTVVPLFVIPQLLFGGLLRPQVVADEITWWPKAISVFTIQRWAFEPALATDTYSQDGVLIQDYPKKENDKYEDLKIVQFKNMSIVSLFFHTKWYGHVALPVLCLFAGFMAFLFLGYWKLRRRMAGGTL